MKKLEECNWKAFCLEQLFQIKIGKNIDKICADTTGNEAYITRTEFNNGLAGFIAGDSALKNEDFPVITIGNETAKSFVQNFPFFTGTKVNIMVPKVKMSVPVLQFIATSLDKHRKNFSYSFTANSTRLKELQVLLPVNSKDEPDYAFMEEYMREVERQQKEKYKAHIQKKIEELGDVEKLEDKEWKAFSLKNIFDEIQRGKRLKTDDHIVGSMPYVSSSSIDNGVDNFIGNEDDVRIFEDCITLANSGSVGTAFYQPFKFVASDHVTKLKQASFSKHVYLFIANQVSKLGEKYSFNREINDKRLGREYIMLPINSDGEPDYVFMESYMKRKEMEMLKRYVDFIDVL